MNTDNFVRYKHHKPPYEYTPRLYRCGVRETDCTPCSTAKPPSTCSHPNSCECKRPSNNGLLRFRNWWERIKVDLAVNGEHITGTPIFVKENTLRVINDDYSYFIPVDKIDYIRTGDGLRSSFL